MEYLEIFEWIVKSSIIASILALIIFFLRALIKSKISPNFMCYIWMIVIIKLIFPYGVQSNISIYNIFDYVKSTNIYMMNNTQYEIKKSNSNVSNTSISEKNDNSNLKNDIPIQSKDKINSMLMKKYLFIIWLIGTCLLASYTFLSHFRLNKMIKKQTKYIDKDLKNILDKCLDKLNINRHIRVVITDEINSPSLYGFIKPVILIQETILNKSKRESLNYIFLHELCHLKRRDNIVALIICILKIIYWFNPIIIYALNTMKSDCEIACDFMVLKYIDKNEVKEYGNTIIDMLKYINYKHYTSGTISMLSNKKNLKERITTIGRNKKFGTKSIILGVSLVLVLTTIGLTSKKVEGKAENIFNSNVTEDLNKSSDLKNIKNNDEENKSITNQNENNGNIVIYNTHAEETYNMGYSMVDIDNLLNSKLSANGITSTVLKNDKYTNYIESYKNSRNLVMENIKDYKNDILLDIHRDSIGSKSKAMSGICIAIAENNPDFKENKEFAELILSKIKEKGVNVSLHSYKRGKNAFNQDLSNKSILINIGDEESTENEINEYTDSIVYALKNCK